MPSFSDCNCKQHTGHQGESATYAAKTKTGCATSMSSSPSARRFLRRWLAAMLAVVATTASVARSQNYVPPIVASAQTTLLSGATNASPGQIAVDKAGNVFYVDHNSPYALKEIPAAAPTTQVSLITGLGQYNSDGVFVDPKGNLWVANGNGTATISGSTAYIGLLEIPAANGLPNVASVATPTDVASLPGGACSATSTAACYWAANTFAVNITSYYSQPSALTVDASGNVYFADYNSKKIISFNIANPSVGTLLATAPTANNQASVALDGAGNLYYCDDASTNYGANGTGKLSLVTGGALTNVGTTATLTSALITSCIGVAGDPFGNLYVEGGSTGATAQLSEVPFEGTALNFADEFGIITNVANGTATGLATVPGYAGNLDANGNYYFATTSGIVQLQINGYNFGSVNVGNTASSPALNLYVNVNPAASISSYFPTGSPTTSTTAAYLQSFPFSGTKSFASGSSFSQGANFSLVMNFQPIHPGLLKGSFTPRSNGADAAIVNLQGTGVGPQALFLPGTPSLLFKQTTGTTPVALNAPQGIAVDTYGDIFVADTGNGKVVADCLASTTQNEDGSGGNTSNTFCSLSNYTNAVTALGTGFNTPVALALDGAQGLYVLDSASASTPLTYINGQTLTSTAVVPNGTKFGGTALSAPGGLALDGYANLYIADTGNNRIVKAHTYGAVLTQNVIYLPSTTLIATKALSGPTGLAVDQFGNLFIADTGNNRIVKFTAAGVASVVGTGSITLSAPRSVAVYPSGQLVVTDANGVYLVNGSSNTALSFGTAFTATGAKGVALDPFGNIVLSNTTGNQVLGLNLSAGQTITFPATSAGASSSTVAGTVVNTGNASLVDTALTVSSGFTTDPSNTCTATSTTVAGGTCSLGLRFSPSGSASGTVTGTATLTDNQLSYTLNNTTSNQTATFATTGTQSLNLTGSATSSKTAQTITFTPLTTPVTYGQTTTETLSATASSGLAVTFSVLSGPGTITNGNTLNITGAGSIVVAADQAGNSTYAQAQEATQTVVVNPAPQTITFAPLTTPITYTTTPITLSATGGASGNPVTFSVISGPGTVSGNQLTVTGVGTIVVAADQAGSANFAAATRVTQSVVVNKAPQTITFPQPPSPIAYTTTPITLNATASSGLAVTYSLVSGPATLSGNTLTITGIGTVVVAANQAGDANNAAAPQVTRSIVVNAIATVATPVFSLSGGSYNGTQALFITDTTAGATIYYTTDGSTPTTSSNVYSGTIAKNGINIATTTTVNAIAVETGFATSSVASATFTIFTSTEGFTFALSANSLTVHRGSSATVSVTVTPQNGFNHPLIFDCLGLSPGLTCSFNPATVSTTPSQAPVTTVLTVSAAANAASLFTRSNTFLAGSSLAALLLMLGWRKRRKHLGAIALLALLAFLPALGGCGSSSSTTHVSTITIGVEGGAVRQSINLPVTIE